MAAVPAATLEGSILEAARIGDRDTVVAWLDSPGADVNAVGHDGMSLLMAVVCRYGEDAPTRDAEASLEVARELLGGAPPAKPGAPRPRAAPPRGRRDHEAHFSPPQRIGLEGAGVLAMHERGDGRSNMRGV